MSDSSDSSDRNFNVSLSAEEASVKCDSRVTMCSQQHNHDQDKLDKINGRKETLRSSNDSNVSEAATIIMPLHSNSSLSRNVSTAPQSVDCYSHSNNN